MTDLRHTEIEHKYVVDGQFDLPRFRDVLASLSPVRTTAIRVRDRYFLTEGGRARRFLVRHRYDAEIHQLTIKALEEDTETRTEINLDLGQHAGSQDAAVDAFVDQLGVVWRGTLQKDLEAWYFADCEVVHYVASTDGREVRCVEFEATRKDSLAGALDIVRRFEQLTGFQGLTRSRLSLPQLLFPELRDALER